MEYLIIYAHPATDGHCSSILEQVKKTLAVRQDQYELIDLYQENYDPILHEVEHYTVGNREVSQRSEELQALLKRYDQLIFIYPVWWGSMPAILKGFFDRVLTSGFAFYYEGGLPKPLLKGKNAIVFTTSGSPKFYNIVTGYTLKRLIKRHILGFCGIKTQLFHLGGCQQLDDSKRKQIKQLVNKALKICSCSCST